MYGELSTQTSQHQTMQGVTHAKLSADLTVAQNQVAQYIKAYEDLALDTDTKLSP